MMRVAPRFTTRQWLVGVGLVAYSLAIGRALDVVLGWFAALLIVCYLAAGALSARWRLGCAGACFVFALVPVLWIGNIGYMLPGSLDRLFPRMPYTVSEWFDLPCEVVEIPLVIACEVNPQFGQAIRSPRPWERVEPFMVFAFWSGLTLVFAMSLISSLLSRRRRRGCPQP